MNWLAHLYLSEPSPEFRLGNLLPDLLNAPQLQGLPAEVLRGIDCHRRIDAFTDNHLIVRRSRDRIAKPYRRFSGILADVFYDHFLAVSWQDYSQTPLGEFSQDVYQCLEQVRLLAPEPARSCLQRMSDGDFLGAYRSLPGIEMALARIGARLRRPVNLGAAIAELKTHYDQLNEDFTLFFPELRDHVQPARR